MGCGEHNGIFPMAWYLIISRPYAPQVSLETPVWVEFGNPNEGRPKGMGDFFNQLGLSDQRILSWNRDTILFPWKGDRIIYTVYLLLLHQKLRVKHDGISLTVMDATEKYVREKLKAIAVHDAIDPISLVSQISDKQAEKYDCFVDEELLNQEFVAKNLDLPGAYETIDEFIR